ncbi:MAG: UDP-3-O-(3-hydroxymyristoyl)glucosamine N-acyltransferase [Pseudomonadota bacterium]
MTEIAQTTSFTLSEIAEFIDAAGDQQAVRIVGESSRQILSLATLEQAQDQDVTHLSSASYKRFLANTAAGAVILSEADLEDCPCDAIVVSKPYLAFARISQLFAKPVEGGTGHHETAYIDATATVASSACIGPNAYIGADVEIGERVIVGANTSIGARCKVAQECKLASNVTLYSDVRLGDRTTIHSGAVIGADGFGFTPDGSGHLVEIAQIGGVKVGCDVSIGANTTIDCGAIGDTVIEDGVKIDNQVQIGHNSHIGAHTLICGCVGIVGSTKIGRHCVLAGGVGVGGEKPIELCDGVIASATVHITQSISEPGVYSGSILHQPHNLWRRNILRFAQLDGLFKRVKRLESQVEERR